MKKSRKYIIYGVYVILYLIMIALFFSTTPIDNSLEIINNPTKAMRDGISTTNIIILQNIVIVVVILLFSLILTLKNRRKECLFLSPGLFILLLFIPMTVTYQSGGIARWQSEPAGTRNLISLIID